MNITDLYNAIPNKEDVDSVLISTLFARITNLEQMVSDIPNQPIVMEEVSREGNIRYSKNPWWDIFRNEYQGCTHALSELNLTPKSRKALLGKIEKDAAPTF